MSKRKRQPVTPDGEMILDQQPLGEVVETVPAKCPHCDEVSNYDVLAKTHEMYFPGRSPGGCERTHIVWYRVRCSCGGVYSLAQHELRDTE